MRRLFGITLLLAAVASGRTVTRTFARITNVTISGPAEHTLVIMPDYPPYTRHYAATWDVEYYDADVEIPDDNEDEETEQENGGGTGGDVTFATSVEWSISGAGAAFAEGNDTTAAEIDVDFISGNIEDVHLMLQIRCACTAGDGVGDSHAADFTIHSPVWDPYHPIGMYASRCRIGSPRIVGAGEPVFLQILDFCNNEYDRRIGADIQTPMDFLRTIWNLPAGFSNATTAYALMVTASGTAQNGTIGAAIDDLPRPSPPTSGAPATMPPSPWSPSP